MFHGFRQLYHAHPDTLRRKIHTFIRFLIGLANALPFDPPCSPLRKMHCVEFVYIFLKKTDCAVQIINFYAWHGFFNNFTKMYLNTFIHRFFDKKFNYFISIMKPKAVLASIIISLGLIATGSANAFTMRMVVDNDFAIFSGTTTGINSLLYQNDDVWMSQIPKLSTLSFSLPTGDTMFYVLGMGGGGEENISGLVNGVNMTDPSVNVSMSQDIRGYLTGYSFDTVTNGNYNATLNDVQAAFSNVVWGATVFNTSDIVIKAGGFGSGFSFDDRTAHLFSFNAMDVGLQPPAVPEPASIALLCLGLAGIGFSRLRKLISKH